MWFSFCLHFLIHVFQSIRTIYWTSQLMLSHPAYLLVSTLKYNYLTHSSCLLDILRPDSCLKSFHSHFLECFPFPWETHRITAYFWDCDVHLLTTLCHLGIGVNTVCVLLLTPLDLRSGWWPIFLRFLFLWIWVYCLHVCLCTVCIQCLQRPEDSIRR